MIRQPGWERRLTEWADYTVGQPFVWGLTDCATLAALAIHAMTLGRQGPTALTGVEPYGNRTGARRASIATGGFRTHLRTFGFTEHPVTHAQHGDIIVMPPVKARALEHAMVVIDGKLLDSRETKGAESAVRWAPMTEAAGGVAVRL